MFVRIANISMRLGLRMAEFKHNLIKMGILLETTMIRILKRKVWLN